MWSTPAHIQKTIWLLLKWKIPLILSLSSCFFFFILTLPSLSLFSLSSSLLLRLSLSTLIAICAIIMAHQWEFDWCLSDSNKQGWCRGMLSRWEKIKQIRDRILWLERAAFGEWILQDAKKSTQHAWEWKTDAGREPRREKDQYKPGNRRWECFFLVTWWLREVESVSDGGQTSACHCVLI